MPKYRLTQVEARQDGSGGIAWDIWAIDDEGGVIPGKHMTILTPHPETHTALSGGGVPAKLKALLKKYLPDKGWDNSALVQTVAENDGAESVRQELSDFVDGMGGYPIDFSA